MASHRKQAKVKAARAAGQNNTKNKAVIPLLEGDEKITPDAYLKQLTSRRPEDLVKLAGIHNEGSSYKPYASEFVPKRYSRLDRAFWVHEAEKEYLLNIEIQGYYDATLPARMLRYRADIWESTLSKKRGIPSLKQIVILTNREADHAYHGLQDLAEDFNYSYNVIKVWELKRKDVIERSLYSVYPLLPLMEADTTGTKKIWKTYKEAKAILDETMEAIKQIDDEALRKDVKVAMIVLIKGKYPISLLRAMVTKEEAMESPILKEWFEEWFEEIYAEKSKEDKRRVREAEKAMREAEKKAREAMKEAERKAKEAMKEAERKAKEAKEAKEAERKAEEARKEAERKAEDARKEAERKAEEAAQKIEEAKCAVEDIRAKIVMDLLLAKFGDQSNLYAESILMQEDYILERIARNIFRIKSLAELRRYLV